MGDSPASTNSAMWTASGRPGWRSYVTASGCHELAPTDRGRNWILRFGGADRLAAAALTGCQGRRCVWTHDFAPALHTAGSDVDRCVVVGVPNEVTPAAVEFRLGAAVAFVDPTAGAASLRRVSRV